MGVLIILLVVLAGGIGLGFMLGFSRAMREAAARLQQPKLTVSPWLWIAGACLCWVIAVGSSLYTWRFVSNALRVTGTVTEMRQHKDGAGYAPTFAFRDAVGTEHLVVTSVYSSPPEHRVGDSVGVLYLATDPKNARLEGFSYLWGLPTATGVIGAFNLLVGLGLLLWPRIAPQFGKQNA